MRHNALYLIVFSSALTGCGSTVAMRQEPAALTPQSAAELQVDARRTEALLQALLALEIDYRNGGRSPEQGFDCSGLVAHVYREAYGIQLPPNARQQSELGTPIRFADLQPGDLVFYNTLGTPYSHVGIYLGDSRFVHAPKVGARVRIESVRAGFWLSRFNGARRIAA